MGAVIAPLEAAGLVSGTPDPKDGRQTILSLTDACRKWVEEGRAARQDWLTRTLQARLSPPGAGPGSARQSRCSSGSSTTDEVETLSNPIGHPLALTTLDLEHRPGRRRPAEGDRRLAGHPRDRRCHRACPHAGRRLPRARTARGARQCRQRRTGPNGTATSGGGASGRLDRLHPRAGPAGWRHRGDEANLGGVREHGSRRAVEGARRHPGGDRGRGDRHRRRGDGTAGL